MMSPNEIKRMHYYEGQYLRTQDFQDEQAYHIEMRRRHLIAHHNWGILTGLEIDQDNTSGSWAVHPGMAVDGYGREIVLFNAEPLDIAKIAAQLAGKPLPASLNIWIGYWLNKTNPPPPGYGDCNKEPQFTRLQESFRLVYQNDIPFKEPKTPVHGQKLPDDPLLAPWYFYLGTIQWNTTDENPTPTIVSVSMIDPSGKKRRYVTDELEQRFQGLERLQEEFTAELASLKSRIEALENGG